MTLERTVNKLCIVIVGCGISSLGMRGMIQRCGALCDIVSDNWHMHIDIGLPERAPIPSNISDFLANQEAKEMVRRRHYLAKNQGRKPFMMRRKLGG